MFRSSLGLAALVFFVSSILVAPVGAQAPASTLRVLLVTGNKSYERAAFLDVFSSNPGIELTHVEHTAKEADAWERADTTSCDAVVLYDMPRDITDTQRARFLALFERGVGVVALHHALVSFQRWPEYERIIGGRWFDVPEKGGDPRETPSGYEHDVDQQIRVVPGHPVTNGVSDFAIHDEIYWGYRVGKDVTPLLTTSHPKSGNPIAWTRVEQKSRVVYLQLGHGPSAYSNASYRRLIHNAIRFAARR
jgi:uncharacterized protein